MLRERLQDITADTLLALCEQGRDESITLDFKRQLYAKSDEGKAEFQKDVCAFANTEGGDLVIGISDNGDRAGDIHPIDSETFKQAEKRLLDTLGAVEPRIVDVQFHEVPVTDGYVLILRVRKSLTGPHRFKNRAGKDGLSFPIRNGTNNIEMTYDQLRDAFGRTESLINRANSFRQGRTDLLISKLLRPLPAKPFFVAHLIPIESFSGRMSIDLHEVHGRYIDIRHDEWGSACAEYNLDGLVVSATGHSHNSSTLTPYVQVFRTGAMEAVETDLTSDDRGQRCFDVPYLARTVRHRFSVMLASVEKCGLHGSALAGLSVHDVSGIGMRAVLGTTFADRDDLLLPERWIESLEMVNVDAIVLPLLDTLWQAFRRERCPFYDHDGKWVDG